MIHPKKKSRGTQLAISLIPALLLLVNISVNSQSVNLDSMWYARYETQHEGQITLNKMFINFHSQLQTQNITETVLASDMDTLKRYNFWFNVMINECNQLQYPNNIVGSMRMDEITKCINDNKSWYKSDLQQIQTNYNIYAQRQQNQMLSDMLTGLLKLAINYYTGGFIK